MSPSLARASAAWGKDPPDWVAALAAACDVAPQTRVAARIGYSASAISQALSGKYKGDLAKLEAAVRGALMGETVECPVLGAIGRDQCLRNQRQLQAARSSAGDPVRQALRRTCPTCRHRVHGDAAC